MIEAAAISWDEAAGLECRHICVHEAGHAIAARLVGASARVRLAIKRDADGRVRFFGVTSENLAPKAAADRAFVAMGGIVAELKYCQQMGWPTPPLEVFAVDRKSVEAVVKPGAIKAFADRVRGELEKSEVWSAVMALADALALCWPEGEGAGEMDTEDVAAIVGGGFHGRCAT
jgi:hypothetical protein